MALRRAPPARSRERKGRAASASEPRPLRCGGWGTGEKAGLGHGGTGGPPGRYFRATPVPRNSSCVRLRVLDSKGEPFGSPGICLGEISGRLFLVLDMSLFELWISRCCEADQSVGSGRWGWGCVLALETLLCEVCLLRGYWGATGEL